MNLEEISFHRWAIVALDFDGTATNWPSPEEEGDCEIDLSGIVHSDTEHADFLQKLQEIEWDESELFKKYDHFNQLYLERREWEIKDAWKQIGKMYDKKGQWNNTIMQVIGRANSADADVFIITASWQILVKAIIKEAGIKVKAVLGKTFVTNREWYNKSVRFHPRWEKKIQVLAKQLWGNPLIHLACGDSATSDGPMVRLAQHGFLRNKETGLFEPTK